MLNEIPLYPNSFNREHFISLADFKFQLAYGQDVYIPVFGSFVACGLFGVSEDFICGYQSLDERFVKNKSSTFFFQADGDSMVPTISKGNILLVDRALTPMHGSVCVFCYEGQLICKRLIKNGKNLEAIILRSDNSLYRDIVIEDGSSVEVWGVVISRHEELR